MFVIVLLRSCEAKIDEHFILPFFPFPLDVVDAYRFYHACGNAKEVSKVKAVVFETQDKTRGQHENKDQVVSKMSSFFFLDVLENFLIKIEQHY
jgi:hypothetical protein